jgi:quinolinate synthase
MYFVNVTREEGAISTRTSELTERIAAKKREYGSDLLILGHHYQSAEIIALTDIQGDSLELARQITALKSRHVVFCGVHFMAETAAILAAPRQHVYIPDHSAGCVMANMAPPELLEKILDRLNVLGCPAIPLAYVNSTAEVKALCGRYGGTVCTSANAGTMLDWALQQGERVLFLPDKNLGLNTAHQLELPEEEVSTLDIRQSGSLLDAASLAGARLLLWPGVCAVHHLFKLHHARRARAENPGARVVVHPECSPALVAEADAVGSTSFIIDFVRKAPPGSTIFVGTEINLVSMLRTRHEGVKDIRPLAEVACSNMAKMTLDALAALLDNLQHAAPVIVSEEVRKEAAVALERMLLRCCH